METSFTDFTQNNRKILRVIFFGVLGQSTKNAKKFCLGNLALYGNKFHFTVCVCLYRTQGLRNQCRHTELLTASDMCRCSILVVCVL